MLNIPRYSHDQLAKKSHELLLKHNPDKDIPVPIESIVEFSFGIEIVPLPSLKAAYDIDSFLANDLSEIWVDQAVLESRSPNRYRFSLAHELAHVVLHKDVISEMKFSSVSEWVKVMQTIPELEWDWLEYQAYTLAGLLLVPSDGLNTKLKLAIEMARQQGARVIEAPDEAEPFICEWLGRQFQVSGQVIQKRLRKAGLWPPEQ